MENASGNLHKLNEMLSSLINVVRPEGYNPRNFEVENNIKEVPSGYSMSPWISHLERQ